jgi:SAM-dependent methyltransferase
MMATYAFDNAWQLARQRLDAIEAWFDPGTICHLSARGVGSGWHCLEVGAGGSIAAWLGDRVGPEGSVLATDLDTRHVEALGHPHVRALRHDVVRDPLPPETFDLAHLRLVLAHLSDRQAALERLATALKPGGWLLAEEMDFASAALDPSAGARAVALFTQALAAHHRMMARHGMDPFYGRRLLGELQGQGLVATGADGRSACCRGGSPESAAWRLTFEQLREELVEMGWMSDDEVAAIVALFDDPTTIFLTQTTVAAWGQRPRDSWAAHVVPEQRPPSVIEERDRLNRELARFIT